MPNNVVADPGFPLGGTYYRRGCASLLFCKSFAENCMTMKEFEQRVRRVSLHLPLSGVGTALAPSGKYLDPPLLD